MEEQCILKHGSMQIEDNEDVYVMISSSGVVSRLFGKCRHVVTSLITYNFDLNNAQDHRQSVSSQTKHYSHVSYNWNRYSGRISKILNTAENSAK